MLSQLTDIARLPHLADRIVVYPDASPKPFGFPSGIVVTTTPDRLYPLSAPDMGCGYLVLDTGIALDPDDVNAHQLEAAFDEVTKRIGVASAFRPKVTTPVEEIMAGGLAAVGAPTHFSADCSPAEENNSWPTEFSSLDREFTRSTLQGSLGSASGHFVACYVVHRSISPVAPPSGRVIAVVHVGAAPIRDRLNQQGLLVELAAQAVESGISSVEDARKGLFTVDLTAPEGRAFLGMAMASRNFGYANRQLVADQLLEGLLSHLQEYAVREPVQLRHVDHVAFEAHHESIRSRRGLQPLHPTRPVFITGGEHTHAYLCDTGSSAEWVDGLCCHGVPTGYMTESSAPVPPRQSFHVEPEERRHWAHSMVSNTAFNKADFASCTSNLETVIRYLDDRSIAHPTAVLRQLMNYRETGL
ncbi:RtcB family protein [Streptomyces sp. NPDC096934]|uniref:RtcB family protein n=1 Tax=Streptomyces sp. NPDC096934 TaxID=3155551 RepID=UPI003328C703